MIEVLCRIWNLVAMVAKVKTHHHPELIYFVVLVTHRALPEVAQHRPSIENLLAEEFIISATKCDINSIDRRCSSLECRYGLRSVINIVLYLLYPSCLYSD